MVSAGGDQPNWAAVAARWHRLRPRVDAPLRGGLCTALLGPPEPHGPLDVRVEFRQFMVDHNGVPETGMPAWTLCQTISVADSAGVEASATVPAKDFAVVASDVHGCALRTMSLADLTRRARRVFVDNHLDSDSRLGIERVSARFRAALVPVHRNNSKWRTQVRYVVYDPTTQSADRPCCAHIVSSVAGCSLHTSRAAAVDGFTPLYSQLRREENGESVPGPHCYATDVSRLGAPELVRPLATGPKGAVTGTDDASAWVVSIPIVPGRPEVFGKNAPARASGFAGFGRRSSVPEEEDWYEQPDRRAQRAAAAARVDVGRVLREGRIEVGHYAADADSLQGRLLTVDDGVERLPEACGVSLYAVPCGNKDPTREQLDGIATDLAVRVAEARAAALASRKAPATPPGSPRNFPAKKARAYQHHGFDLDVEMEG